MRHTLAAALVATVCVA